MEDGVRRVFLHIETAVKDSKLCPVLEWVHTNAQEVQNAAHSLGREFSREATCSMTHPYVAHLVDVKASIHVQHLGCAVLRRRVALNFLSRCLDLSAIAMRGCVERYQPYIASVHR